MITRLQRRRLMLAASVLVIAPLPAIAQRAARIPTVGLLWPDLAFSGSLLAFRDELKSLGYIEGRTIVIESDHLARTGGGELDAAAEKLVAQKVNVILAGFAPAARAARKATQSIPIVAVLSVDPVEAGFARSFARPGANVTGVAYVGRNLSRKSLEILKDSVPGLRRVAVLTPLSTQSRHWSELQAAAATLELTLVPVIIPTIAELDSRVAPVTQTGAQAILWVGGTMFGAHHQKVVEAVGRTRLPAIYPQISYARRGGLMSYSADQSNNFRVAARYVDQILKGAQPADLPFEQANKFEFVVNLKTAKAQGIRIPEAIVLRATQVIE
jgi:putative ABC transport system substrate-binding protein